MDVSIIEVQEIVEKEVQAEMPVDNIFSEGIYCRTVSIPKDTFVIGKRHKKETMNILLSGVLTVYTEKGEELLTSPAIFISKPLTKKVGFAHTDVVFANIHATDSKNLEQIEDEFIVKDADYKGHLEIFKGIDSVRMIKDNR